MRHAAYHDPHYNSSPQLTQALLRSPHVDAQLGAHSATLARLRAYVSAGHCPPPTTLTLALTPTLALALALALTLALALPLRWPTPTPSPNHNPKVADPALLNPV